MTLTPPLCNPHPFPPLLPPDSKVIEIQGAYNAAMASGLSFFDTAEVYGTKQFGGEDSEKLLGK